MTQAERTRTIKYALAERSRWLLHRQGDTKRIKDTVTQEKNKKRKRESRKQGTKASKKIVLKASP